MINSNKSTKKQQNNLKNKISLHIFVKYTSPHIGTDDAFY